MFLGPDLCPACGAHIDAVTALTGAHKPREGDFSICHYCAEVLRFGADLTVSPAGEGWAAGLDPGQVRRVRAVQWAVRRRLQAQPATDVGRMGST